MTISCRACGSFMYSVPLLSYRVRRRCAQVLQRMQEERDRLQLFCDRFLHDGRADRAACMRFTQAVKRLSELHDQIYVMERALGAPRFGEKADRTVCLMPAMADRNHDDRGATSPESQR